MTKPFTRTFRVRWSEIEANGRVGPAQHLRYLVETAYDWGESRGLGLQDAIDLGIVWVIRETEFHFHRALEFNNRFDFSIWMVEWRRVRGTRAFEMQMAHSAEVIAQGAQQVVALDAKSLRPIRVPEQKIAPFRMEEPRRIPLSTFPKVSDLPSDPTRTRRRLEWYDLDMLAHLNNASTCELGMQAGLEVLSDAGWDLERMRSEGMILDIRRLHIQHLAPAGWGDTLQIDLHAIDLGRDSARWLVSLNRKADGAAIGRVLFDWCLIDRELGDIHPLPPELRAA